MYPMLKYFLCFVLVFSPLASFAEEFVAGKDYVIIPNPEKLNEIKNAVSVTEYFSYGCPWCYRIEPALNQWVNQQGTKIFYNKVPVVFNKDWEYYAKAHYTAVALSLEPKLAPELFKAIVKDKQRLNSNQAMVDFFAHNGVDTKIAHSAFNQSPSIDIEINDSKREMVRYQVNAVPALVINNQYKTDLQMAKSEERLFAILNFLVAKSNQS